MAAKLGTELKFLLVFARGFFSMHLLDLTLLFFLPCAYSQEEQMEAAIDNPVAAEAKDTKPVVLPQDVPLSEGSSAPRLISPSGSTSSIQSHDGTTNGEDSAHCRVCLKDGAVVMCDGCKKCYHLDCHLPVLQEIPRCELPLSSLLPLT